MSGLFGFARSNGWAQLLPRVGRGLSHRVRDGFTARRLGAAGFRTGRSPRLLGLSHIHLGPDFRAGDSLWLEAVVRYGEGSGAARFDPQLRIGVSARISDNVHIACLHRVTVGDHLLCGSRVIISDHTHGGYGGPGASDPAIPPAERPLVSTGAVRIGANVWLGDGVAVLAGAEIGDGCVIGANSVVTSAIPPRTIAVGAPARVVRRWDDGARAWVPVSKT